MSTPHRSEPFHEPLPLAEHAGKWFIATAIAFIVLGTLAILMPFVAGLAIAKLVGVLLIVGGVMYSIDAFKGEGTGHKIWRAIVAVLYVLAGLYFLFNPLIALTTLTLFLAGVLFVEAFSNVAVYFQGRHVQGSAWFLVNAVITFILAFMIWRHWPSISIWAIGTLVGIDLLVNGFSRLMLGSTMRNVARRIEP
jgi:uncharacterized membrane protein HdeD (DUF308 family)